MSVILWDFIPLTVNPSTDEQALHLGLCFETLKILKESTFLQNFVFTLVIVNEMAASNSDAN